MNLLTDKRLFPGIVLLMLIVLPLILDNPFLNHMVIRAATFSIVIMGLTLFIGYTGQISLGHAAFFGLGAYLSGMMVKAGMPYPAAMLIAIMGVSLLGYIVGLIVLRTSGDYLALASIAVAVIIQVIIKNAGITGGPSGLTAVPPPSFFGWEILSDLAYYYYVLFAMVIGFFILKHIIESRTGDALQAIANNELAAQSLGIPVFRYKVLSFTVSTAFAALAGVLFVHYDGFIDPDRLGIDVSVLFLIMVFIGGIGSLYGSIIGAFSLTFLSEYAQEFGQYNILVYGSLLAIIILFLPKGLVDLPHKLRLRISK
ncbi:branched-chain amino acid ABC transporter permease [Castellaniella sp.]|uniref:branched-chain amino acid ABC transporter permease n=1 Tax=Castellaniella sp. TaxID=1955812 RepID=UPI002AFF268B|nr:branched-chain amino acid ABC transporter permease [Castellaniella sp.]